MNYLYSIVATTTVKNPFPVKAPESETAVLNRMLGREAQSLETKTISVNSLVECEWTDWACEDEHDIPEEHGRVVFLPISNDQCSVHLVYMLHRFEDGITASTLILRFHPDFFLQWPMDLLLKQQAFRFDRSMDQQFVPCHQSRILIQALTEATATTGDVFSLSLKRTETALHLLRRAVEILNVPFTACPVPACRFLAFEGERDKVFKAREILDQQLDRPLTIKELARKVAMNECYLKKGFKALTGKTIHEFQHERRIARAKDLLQQSNRSVSDVAMELGFSSISHFSTAFKKATGLKPCELLK